MGLTAMEKQDRMISQFLRTAKYADKNKSETVVEKTIRESKAAAEKFAKKKAKEQTKQVFINGVGYNISPEKAAEIAAKNIAEIENREANKKAARKAKAAKTKAAKAAAAEKKAADEAAAFKAMIAKKAQEQIAARKNK